MAPPPPFFVVIRTLTLTFVLQLASSQTGFVSIDCGGPAAAPYKDANGIVWTPDQLYMPAVLGHSASIQPNTSAAPLDLDSTLSTLRYFPASLPQTKFCYSLGPVVVGTPYLIRAIVVYGNYDSLNRGSISFSLLFNADLWSVVQLSQTSGLFAVFELHAPALTTDFSVCVARTGTDEPFINSLELRSLVVGMSSVTRQLASGNYATNTKNRINYGAKSTGLIRYPDDQYDRFWYPSAIAPTTSTKQNITVVLVDAPPSSVLQTAYGDGVGTDYGLIFSALGTGAFFLVLYFAEIGGATIGQRVFDIDVNGAPFYKNFDILGVPGAQPFKGVTVYSNQSLMPQNSLNVTIVSTSTATKGPIVGAAELLRIWPEPLTNTTDTGDVAALDNVKKSLYNLSDWTGDPCLPTGQGYTWVTCSPTTAPRIASLSLSSQNLSGSLPPDLGMLTALEEILLNNNEIGGNIPNLSALQQLQKLDLENNNLQGPIPDFLAALPNLSELLLQGNNLSGPIPESLLEKTKNASFRFSYDKNPYLCVTPNATCKVPTAPGSTSTRKLQSYVIILIVIGVLSVLALSATTIFCLCTKNKMRISCLPKKGSRKRAYVVNINPQPSSESTELGAAGIAAQTLSFTLQDVKTITNDFHDRIGRGGFGDVFLGRLTGGRYVAVKTSSKDSSQGVREFLTEVSILSRVHHKNLVSLVGYCNEPPQRMLIYEYMSKGTLSEHLYGRTASGMSWRTRIMIAIDAAQGLEYLHFSCQPRIIHRDVKSSNILLNDKMEAKVADFGLSKPKLEDNVSHIAASNVMGTHGYVDPEYYATSLLTDKSDVYSFGVVLFELVCGGPAVDINREKPNLTDWVKGFLKRGDLRSIVDPVLGRNYNENEESMWKVAELGLKSTDRERSNRPDMNYIVVELKEALRLEGPQKHRDANIASARDFPAHDPRGISQFDSARNISQDQWDNFTSSSSFVRPR